MPFYDFVCNNCQTKREIFVVSFNNLEKEDLNCCGQKMSQVFSTVPHIVDFTPHFSPTVDKENNRPYFSTKIEMVEWYKNHDLILEKV